MMMFSFFSATIRLWNSLPDSIVNLESPEAFQKSANFLLTWLIT